MTTLEKTRGQLRLSPIPGNWYVDKTGALFKVKALVYEAGELNHLILDYPRGSRHRLPIELWQQYIYQVNTTAEHQSQA
ncbi:MAG: hypothetical protein OEZ10_01625 [Gammaproteobacteria bacterium]|nr:hypothetical protein [Gammaproteobacteria bacterium]